MIILANEKSTLLCLCWKTTANVISNSSYLWGFYNDTTYIATDTVHMLQSQLLPVRFSTSIAIACICCIQLYAKVLDEGERMDI